MRPYKLTLNPGECLAVIGAIGSGKTTFCNMLVNQLEDKKYLREIYINEQKIEFSDQKYKEEIVLFNIDTLANLVPGMTVAENIFLGRQSGSPLSRINWNKIYSETKDILNKLDIKSLHFDQKVEELSILEKILVVICREFSRGVKYFVFDEITRNIESSDFNKFFPVLERLKREQKNLIYVPYRIEEISQIADKVSILYKWDFTGEAVNLSEISYERIINIMMGQEQRTNPFTDAFLEKYRITEREKEIIILVANGFSNQEISERLSISLGTVKNHMYNLFQKTHVKNRMELCNLLKI